MTMKICIVGGGSAGWMSATTLLTKCNTPSLDCEVTLISSKDIPTVCVGESTLERIRDWKVMFPIEDDEFLRETNGTIKHSIKFTNWLTPDSGSFYYPFGEVHHDPDLWWSVQLETGELSHNDYGVDVNSIGFLSKHGKCDVREAHAYHFDATKFAQYLKEKFCEDVNHIEATVVDGDVDENGIKSLRLDNGESIEADLFIDCTGFRSLLLGDYLKEPFKSSNDLLPNDTAWTTIIPHVNKKEMAPVTECTAIENGWVWEIPLWDRVGSGYVYSSKYVSDEDAKQEFINCLKQKGYDPSECEFRKIPMRVGRHERTWVKNVVAIGLSGGFIEPLESNGLLTIHENLIDLHKTLRRGLPSECLKKMYNRGTNRKFDEFLEFVALHYALTQRQDTPYWKDIFNKDYRFIEEREQRVDGFASWSDHLYVQPGFYNINTAGYHYILSGMNVCPWPYRNNFAGTPYKRWSNDPHLDHYPQKEKQYKKHRLSWKSKIKKGTLTSMYDFLKKYVYFDKK